ncbi:MAG: hypothetical protein U9N34_08540, partial [Candidatus Cloacimonadota bacterium]|nr:hypothetical protein [Candidatus Cloacimonadota bacterium]
QSKFGKKLSQPTIKKILSHIDDYNIEKSAVRNSIDVLPNIEVSRYNKKELIKLISDGSKEFKTFTNAQKESYKKHLSNIIDNDSSARFQQNRVKEWKAIAKNGKEVENTKERQIINEVLTINTIPDPKSDDFNHFASKFIPVLIANNESGAKVKGLSIKDERKFDMFSKMMDLEFSDEEMEQLKNGELNITGKIANILGTIVSYNNVDKERFKEFKENNSDDIYTDN